MTIITYRGVQYNADSYKAKVLAEQELLPCKAKVLAEQEQNRNFDLMYRGIKVERKFASKS